MRKLIDSIKSNHLFIIYSVALFIINIILILSIEMKKYEYFEKKLFFIMAIFNLIAFLVYYYLFFKAKSIRIEKLYLMIIIPIGLLYMSFFPMNTVPDEIAHFLRAYEVSAGHFVSSPNEDYGGVGRFYTREIGDGLMSITDYSSLKKALGVKKTNETQYYRFDSSALYSFISYIPQSTGILIGRIFKAPIIIQAYLGRLFSFALFVFLSYLSIKLFPSKKLALLILFMNPILLQEVISLSTDGITIGVSAFLLSYVLYLRNRGELISKKQVTILLISSIVISLCKIVYLPLCLLILLIPKEKFESNKKKILTTAIIIILAIITNLLWLSISSKFLPASGDVNSKEQLLYILKNPIKYLIIIASTYKDSSFLYMTQSFGGLLGYHIVNRFQLGTLIFMLLSFIIIIFDNDGKTNYKKIEKLLVLFIILVIIALISTSLYLQWTPLHSLHIRGIQGRYFLPLYFLLPLLFTKYTLKPKVNFYSKYLCLFIVSYNIYVLSEVFFEFI